MRRNPYLHPEVRADRSDLGCLCLQRAVGDRRSCGENLGRVELVGVDRTAREGVARKSDSSGTCCRSLASGDGTLLGGRRSSEGAANDSCHYGREGELHGAGDGSSEGLWL